MSTEIEIVEYAPRHGAAWRALNEAWLIRYFVLEEKDCRVLGDPQTYVLDPGGIIFMAEHMRVAVGCVSLMRMEDDGYELAKMAVDPGTQGKGVGRKLMNACMEFAKNQKASRLYIETNAILTPAIQLYETAGFVHLPPQPTPYARANVWMEYRL
jgi:putative acetyltransferase